MDSTPNEHIMISRYEAQPQEESSRCGTLAKLLRLHLFDWLGLLGLLILYGLLYLIHPFRCYVGSSTLSEVSYPYKEDTVPFWVVPLIAIAFPLLIFIGCFIYKKKSRDLHHATLGMSFTILITGVITESLKVSVGKPRPSFLHRCFPDGIKVFDSTSGEVICTGLPEHVREAYKSFPSGHASWSFAGLAFLALYLAGKVRAFNRKGLATKIVVVFLPIACATAVAITRVDDYAHFWQDVLIGGLIGLFVAIIYYTHFFPTSKIFGSRLIIPLHR